MKLKLRSIEAFCATVEEQSISGAARRMYLSQPTVSERLAELEKDACVRLLERSRSGVRLTADGAIFYERAHKVLKEATALQATVDNLQEKANSKLRFACCVTVGEHLLPEWLGRFKKKISYAAPMVLMGNDQLVANAVESGTMPIGIVASDEAHDALEVTTVLEDELIIVVDPRHSWARRSISVEELANEPFIARETGSTIRSVIEQTLREAGDVSLSIHMELGSTTAIKEAVESGLGVSILSHADVQRKLEAGTLVRVEGLSIPWSFKLVRHPATPMSDAEEGFYRFILDECKHVRQLGNIGNSKSRLDLAAVTS